MWTIISPGNHSLMIIFIKATLLLVRNKLSDLRSKLYQCWFRDHRSIRACKMHGLIGYVLDSLYISNLARRLLHQETFRLRALTCFSGHVYIMTNICSFYHIVYPFYSLIHCSALSIYRQRHWSSTCQN